MRQAIGRNPHGEGQDKAWGVMDLLATTDFPDIRFKATIQSGSGGNILLIPREGGYMVRLYVDMGDIAADAWLTPDDILDQARSVLAPYTLQVQEIAWFSVYRVGHGSPTSSTTSTTTRSAPAHHASSSPGTPATPTPPRPAKA